MGVDFEDSYPAVVQMLQETIQSSDPDYNPPLILRDKYSKSSDVIGVSDRRYNFSTGVAYFSFTSNAGP